MELNIIEILAHNSKNKLRQNKWFAHIARSRTNFAYSKACCENKQYSWEAKYYEYNLHLRRSPEWII